MFVSRSTGFTLIELLVVLVVIGLSLGFVSFSIDTGSRSRQWLQAAELLAREAGVVLQEAQSDGRNRGLGLVRAAAGHWSWRWYQQRDGHWLVLDTGPGAVSLAGPAGFPRHIDAELRVDAKAIELGNRSFDTSLAAPDMVFFASGEVTPFSLTLKDAQSTSPESIALCADALGRILVVREAKPSCDGKVL